MRWFLSLGAKYLWDALDEPEEWHVGQHTATYRKKVEMWIANGAWFFDGYASEGTPKFTGVIDRHILWWKYKRMTNRRVALLILKQMGGSK